MTEWGKRQRGFRAGGGMAFSALGGNGCAPLAIGQIAWP